MVKTNDKLPPQQSRRLGSWRGLLIFFGALLLVTAGIAAFFIYAARHIR
ncbi:MAG TPA: hypothetical protein VMJ10_21295 [Kofleriaceae bacterium]|nr:hypothetical protein [Kofleriaceae bacterium]